MVGVGGSSMVLAQRGVSITTPRLWEMWGSSAPVICSVVLCYEAALARETRLRGGRSQRATPQPLPAHPAMLGWGSRQRLCLGWQVRGRARERPSSQHLPKPLSPPGFRVAVVSRDGARLEKLKSFVPAPTWDRLHTLLGDVGSEEGAEAAKGALLKSVGKVTDVVSALGFSWWQGGPPHTQTLQELNRVLETLLLSTFTAWKAFFPLVRENPGGSYTFITGGAGERLLMPGTGFLTLGAASVLAFCRVVREEYPDVPCKLNELKINMGVVAQDPGRPGYVSHLEVGAAVASLLEKGSVSHTVLCASSPADLQALAQEGRI